MKAKEGSSWAVALNDGVEVMLGVLKPPSWAIGVCVSCLEKEALSAKPRDILNALH